VTTFICFSLALAKAQMLFLIRCFRRRGDRVQIARAGFGNLALFHCARRTFLRKFALAIGVDAFQDLRAQVNGYSEEHGRQRRRRHDFRQSDRTPFARSAHPIVPCHIR